MARGHLKPDDFEKIRVLGPVNSYEPDDWDEDYWDEEYDDEDEDFWDDYPWDDGCL